MDVAPPEAAYAGGLEAVSEWGSKALSQVFAAEQVSGVLTTPNLQPLSYRKWKLKEELHPA